jgi:hypothetical protein
MSKLFYHFKRYIDVANTNMSNPLVYFLLKNYAFKLVYSTLGTNSTALNESEKALFDRYQKEFQVEKSNNPNVPLMSPDQYKAFLDEYSKYINFENADLDTLYSCKDLIEVLAIYGPLDDNWNKRCKI